MIMPGSTCAEVTYVCSHETFGALMFIFGDRSLHCMVMKALQALDPVTLRNTTLERFRERQDSSKY